MNPSIIIDDRWTTGFMYCNKVNHAYRAGELSWHARYNRMTEMVDWVVKTFGFDDYAFTRVTMEDGLTSVPYIGFKYETDALMFKIRFGEYL